MSVRSDGSQRKKRRGIILRMTGLNREALFENKIPVSGKTVRKRNEKKIIGIDVKKWLEEEEEGKLLWEISERVVLPCG